VRKARCLLVPMLLVACTRQAHDREAVFRLALSGAPEPTAVAADGETRWASVVASPYAGRICIPGSPHTDVATLEVGLRAAGPGVTARLRAGEDEAVEAFLAARWSDLRVPMPRRSTDCAQLAIEGAPGTEVAVSTPLGWRPGRQRPWVVLYVVDTFRFDDSPYAADPGRAGPAFAALADDGIVYRRAFSVTSWTRPSVASLLTGFPPAVHGVFDRQDRLPGSISRLPVVLAEAGWHTAAFSTNPNVLPLWGFLDGFDRFVDIDTETWVQERGFSALRDRVLALVEEHSDRPVFLYVHDNEPHLPYRPLPRYREIFGAPPEGSEAELPRADVAEALPASRLLYRAAIRATSDRFGSLLEALRSAGRYEDALVVLVGDHGEEFGEHGGVAHGRTLYQEQLHVPLVIKPPSEAVAPGAVDVPVTLEDVAPTVLSLLEVPAPPALAERRLPWPGEASGEPRIVMSALDLDGRRADAAIWWPWKYLRASGGEQIFDLAADPAETADLAKARPDLLAQLRSALERNSASGRRGLWLSCVAGQRETVVHAELRPSDDDVPRATGSGLDEGDRVTARPGLVEAEFHLRPAERHPDVARLDPRVAALTQPDRDGLRVVDIAGDFLSIRLTGSGGPIPSLEGPDGSPLPTGGEPLRLTSIEAPVAPRYPAPTERVRCTIHRVTEHSESTPEDAVGPALRERLRALGYLH
jgi:arylsulfatase A-like enzyme